MNRLPPSGQAQHIGHSTRGFPNSRRAQDRSELPNRSNRPDRSEASASVSDKANQSNESPSSQSHASRRHSSEKAFEPLVKSAPLQGESVNSGADPLHFRQQGESEEQGEGGGGRRRHDRGFYRYRHPHELPYRQRMATDLYDQNQQHAESIRGKHSESELIPRIDLHA